MKSIGFPISSEVAKRDFYVDDLMSGDSTVEDTLELQREMIELMKSGGFRLRKWNSNCRELLTHLPSEEAYPQLSISLDQGEPCKTLGLIWDPISDSLKCNINPNLQQEMTKRKVLFIIAQIFHPLGLLGPVVVRAKIFMQKIWLHSLDWEEELPDPLRSEWLHYCGTLININDIGIPRRMTCFQIPQDSEVHGFSDASLAAYGACLYLRTKDANDQITVALVAAKSRVTPLKTISLSRLELSGALLLVRLMEHTLPALNLSITRCYYWTDSTIVLNWLSAPAFTWNTFVSNRVSQIQSSSNDENWRHVKGSENPADLISRGICGDQLEQLERWWTGPYWLQNREDRWKLDCYCNTDEELTSIERKQNKTVACLNTKNASILSDLINRFSTCIKLVRTTSYSLRFIFNDSHEDADERRVGSLTPIELKEASIELLKRMQEESFPAEINHLVKTKSVRKYSNLYPLCPFLDNSGILRVGGRLKNSSLSADQKNPIVLPDKHKLTKLLINYEHERLLHAGPQALLATIRQQYWPLNGRKIVRNEIHKCMTCFRAKPKISAQLMGQLPISRVEPARPFLRTGVDYCGPLYVKTSSRRGAALSKAYVALFVSFITKAIHLELVEDMSKDAFLGAFRRFISRKGRPSHVFSDNGSNFIAAQKELREIKHLWDSTTKDLVKDSLSSEGIKWSFIPPQVAHFGGLWESEVKLLKYHLKRLLSNSNLMLIQLSTLLTQIEAIVNSRPITPISSNPSGLTALTPAHFLVEDLLTTVPEPDEAREDQ